MRKLILILFISMLALSLTGCAKKSVAEEQSGKISIISTVFAPFDFTREIAGGYAEITMLLPPGSECHSYEPTPQDIIKIQNCDIFIYIGGDSDSWVQKVLESMDTKNMEIITLMDCVDVVREELVEGMEEDHEEHEEHEEVHGEHEYDEHVWTSPKNAKLIVQKISDVICTIDSANAAAYEKNTTTYIAKLDELDREFQAIASSAAIKTLVFGDRFPFRYFADAYDFQYFAAFPGCSTETEASAATIAFLIDKVNAEEIPVVFHAEMSNKKMANTISEATGAEVLLFHACHNVTKDEMAAGVTYIDLMKQNIENLKEAVK